MAYTAVAGGAAILGSAYMANEAADQQADAYREAANGMRQDRTAATKYLTPYSKSGQSALPALSGLLTGQQYNPDTGESTQLTPDQRNALFQTSPGYQFRMDQGLKAAQASQAARGNLFSGGALKELTEYGQGIASDEYGNYINQLYNLAGMGQTAASNQSQVISGSSGALANLNLQANMGPANKSQNWSNLLSGVGSMALGGAMSSMGGGSGGGGSNGGSNGGGGWSPNFNTQLQNPLERYK